MSKICFIIGNGFDKTCGMQCLYSEIFPSYCSECPEDLLVQTLHDDLSLWSDFEKDMASNAAGFCSEDAFLKAVEQFRCYLEDYLNAEEKQVWSNWVQRAQLQGCFRETQLSLCNFFKSFSESDVAFFEQICGTNNCEYGFISFNYTDLLDKLVKHTFRCGYMPSNATLSSIIHIHGKLNTSPSSIVLGADNDQQFSSLPFPISDKLRCLFEKPFFNERYFSLKQKNAKQMIAQSDIICIYGKSLGETDMTWNSEIRRWLEAETHHYLVVFLYAYSSMQLKYWGEEHQYRSTAVKSIVKQLCIDESLSKQIFVPIGRDIFNYTAITPPESKPPLKGIAFSMQYPK